MQRIGVSLLSGGLDSTVVTAFAARRCDPLVALTVSYGQRHIGEIAHAVNVADVIGITHHILDIPDLGQLAFHSALTGSLLDLSEDRDPTLMADAGPPTSYVPMRNSILLTVASALLESIALSKIEEEGWAPESLVPCLYIGANCLDYSGYPDCRPLYLSMMEQALNEGSKLASVYNVVMSIEAPLIDMHKDEIIRLGQQLEAPLHLTWSCYAGGEAPCGQCDSCVLRMRGFAGVGIADPAL